MKACEKGQLDIVLKLLEDVSENHCQINVQNRVTIQTEPFLLFISFILERRDCFDESLYGK